MWFPLFPGVVAPTTCLPHQRPAVEYKERALEQNKEEKHFPFFAFLLPVILLGLGHGVNVVPTLVQKGKSTSLRLLDDFDTQMVVSKTPLAGRQI